MSSQAFSWACRQTGMRPGAKLLLAMIANHADKSGVAYPGRETLAGECCYSKQSVTDNMALLVDGGWLARLERRRANGSKTSDWLIMAPASIDRGEMTDADPKEYPDEVAAIARQGSGQETGPDPGESGQVSTPGQVKYPGGPETSVEPTTSLSTTEEALEFSITSLVPFGEQLKNEGWGRARAESAGILEIGEVKEVPPLVKHNGREVPRGLVEDATRALEHFNAATGRACQPFTGRGKPSESLSRIIGAMLDWPAVRAEYRRMIDACLADPWWDGPASTGCIFGPRVVEDSLAKATRPQRQGPSMRDLKPGGRAIARLLAANPHLR